MNEDWCRKRLRIQLPATCDATIVAYCERMLLMVRGVSRVAGNAVSRRLLIVYDDRLIESWQLSDLAGILLKEQHNLLPAQSYHMQYAKSLLALPVLLLGGLSLKRVFFGKSPAADNLVLFELATALSVCTGYPELRSRVQKLATYLRVSDDVLLTGFALLLAFIRESPLVFIAVFVLSYNAYRKKDNTLAAATRAGESIASLSTENIEPFAVQRFGVWSGRIGGLLAGASAVLLKKPDMASGLLLAANPRPAVLGARYALNYGESLTHERCEYIPMHSGMDLYELCLAREIVYLHADDTMKDYEFARSLEVKKWEERLDRHIQFAHIAAFAEKPPADGSPRNGSLPLQRIVLIHSTLEMPAAHQRQGATLYLRGSLQALSKTILLSRALRSHVAVSTRLTGLFSISTTLFTLAGMKPQRLNVLTDLFSLLVLSLSNRLHPEYSKNIVAN